MNRFLFDTLTFLNGFIAVVIIVISAGAGWFNPYFESTQVVGVVLGALAGITTAALICGTIAFLALIERHMRTIAERAPSPRVHHSDRLFVQDERQEPRL